MMACVQDISFQKPIPFAFPDHWAARSPFVRGRHPFAINAGNLFPTAAPAYLSGTTRPRTVR